MNKEEWRDIKGYEGRYQVSNIGRVKSLERTFVDKRGYRHHIKERILKPKTDHNGYLQVVLSKRDKQKTFTVHRLVCKAFHENSQAKPEVNHINENKLDNRACNLEWGTAKENSNHGTRNAKIGKANAKARSKPIGQYTLDGKLIKVWESALGYQRKLGFNQGNLSAVARGKQKTAYGYVWKFIEKGK